MRSVQPAIAAFFLSVALVATNGFADDRVQLKDGDEITGSVVEYSQGKLTVSAGDQSKEIKMKEIKTVQFDAAKKTGQDKITTREKEEIVGTLVEYDGATFSIRVGDKVRKIRTASIATISPEKIREQSAKPDDAATVRRGGAPFRARTADEIMADFEAKEKAKAEAMKGLTVRFPYSRVWVPRDGESIEFRLCELFFDGREPTQGFFKIGADTCEVVMESSDPEVVRPTRDPQHISGPYYFQFKKPGKAVVRISAGNFTAEQEFEVVSAPAAPGDPTDAVIREMGLPSLQSKVYVKWPNKESHDCFFYSPDPGKPFIGEHWWFDKYRDLILSVENGHVGKLGTNRKRTSNQIELRIETPNK